VVRQSGVVRDGAGQPRAGAATLTFAIYARPRAGPRCGPRCRR
jgi:hypothetical protein